MKLGSFPVIDEGDFRESIARTIKEKCHVEYLTEVLNEYEWYRTKFLKVFSPNQPARSVYRFRIVYQLKKGVSRDIEILGTQTFEKFARTIVKAMKWDYDHMHGFTIPGVERPASKMSPWPAPTTLEFFDPHWEDDPFPTYKSDQIKIYQIDYKKFPALEFIFDFGDGHRFKIQYLGARPKKSGEQAANFPRVIAEHGVGPEQYPPVEE